MYLKEKSVQRSKKTTFENDPDKEILERGREGPRISAGDALGARDMSVGVVAQVTLRNELFHTGY